MNEIKINGLINDPNDLTQITYWYEGKTTRTNDSYWMTVLDKHVNIPTEALKDLYEQLKEIYGEGVD